MQLIIHNLPSSKQNWEKRKTAIATSNQRNICNISEKDVA